MAYSVQSDVSNGTLQYIEVRINYFDKAHLSVLIDEIVIPQGNESAEYFWWWDGNRIKMNKPVANGKEVKVRRSTPIGEPLHTFRQGATFKDSTIDENFLQQLYINQENFEGRSGTDIYNDMNHHGYRITSVAPAIAANDAVPFSQYRADSLGATQQRLLAEAANNSAIAARDAANSSKNAAATSATNAANSASTATNKASEALTSANNAASSASTASTKASEAAASANTAKSWADAASATAIPNGSITEAKLATPVTNKLSDYNSRITSIENLYVNVSTDQTIRGKKRFDAMGLIVNRRAGDSGGGSLVLQQSEQNTNFTDNVYFDTWRNELRWYTPISVGDSRGVYYNLYSNHQVNEWRGLVTCRGGARATLDYEGTAPVYAARAHGNVAVQADGNIAGQAVHNGVVSKLPSVGWFRITFNTPMPTDWYTPSVIPSEVVCVRIGAATPNYVEIGFVAPSTGLATWSSFRFLVVG